MQVDHDILCAANLLSSRHEVPRRKDGQLGDTGSKTYISHEGADTLYRCPLMKSYFHERLVVIIISNNVYRDNSVISVHSILYLTIPRSWRCIIFRFGISQVISTSAIQQREIILAVYSNFKI